MMKVAWRLTERLRGVFGGVMTDPLDRGSSSAPPVLGEGCTQRYDPQALTPEDGTEFADAAELWRQLQQDEQSATDSDKQT